MRIYPHRNYCIFSTSITKALILFCNRTSKCNGCQYHQLVDLFSYISGEELLLFYLQLSNTCWKGLVISVSTFSLGRKGACLEPLTFRKAADIQV
jgi:hypothetical protein